MYAPQPPSQPEPTWPPRYSGNAIPTPPSYLPQPVPPQIKEIHAQRSVRQWLRIPLDRPIVTPVLLAILVAIYIPMQLFPDVNNLFLTWGENQNALVVQGQWWRLITATFLHGGFLHILLNGYALYIIGMDLEGLVGKARFAAIYAISGLAGSVASFVFTPANVPSVGASGAIFGLVGALGVYFGLYRRLFGRVGNLQFWNIVVVIVLNMGIGFSGFFPIDNSAHIGGLLAGAAVGYVLAPRYTLGGWASPTVRDLVNTNKGPLPWIAATLIGLVVVFIFIAFLLLFRTGILSPTYLLGR
jgi:rhomboid protease GluP